MRRTQKELQVKSNYQLNTIIAELKGVVVDEEQYLSYGDRDENVVLFDNGKDCVDYCENWSDCGMLIDECGIMTTPVQGGLSNLATAAHKFDKNNRLHSDVLVYDHNVKRAVAIVYILIKQG